MAELDKQERQIICALIRNPRYSDNRISSLTGVPVRTVSRKRARLEQEGRCLLHGCRYAEHGHGAFLHTTHAVDKI